MYMNLKPNQHKRISFSITTMTSLGFAGPLKILGLPLNLAPPPKKKNLIFCSGPPAPQLFWSEIFKYISRIVEEGLNCCHEGGDWTLNHPL